VKGFYALLILLMGLASPLAARVYDPVTVELPNGLQIILVPNHRTPVVHAMLWYRVGAIDEPAGQSGLAHYLEHLMFKGTPNVPAGEFSRSIAAVGGRDNAFTSYDYTAYFVTMPADFLSRYLTLEADRMQNLLLAPEPAATELDVVLAERRQRTEDDPAGRFAEKFARAAYGDHPYGRPVIGARAEIEKLDASHARAFYQQWYAPNNAVLILAGDFAPVQAVRDVQRAFTAIPARALPSRPDLKPQYRVGIKPEIMRVVDKEVRQISIERRYPAPTLTEIEPRIAAALEVLAQILDGGAVGRLYRGLVVERKLATEVGAGYDGASRALGNFTVAMALPPAGDDKAATQALDALLEKLLKQGINQAELELAKTVLMREAVFARDRLMSSGYAFGQALMAGKKVADVEAWPTHIAAVNQADVMAAARLIFKTQDYITGLLLPDPTAAGDATVAVKTVLGNEAIR
jgi:zinc protease